jgi:Apea-like HEPN
MSIELHKGCADRLRDLMAKALRETALTHNIFVEMPSSETAEALDKVLPHDVQRLLESYIGDAPIVTFLQTMVRRDLRDKVQFDQNPAEVPLSNFVEGDMSDVAARYLEELRALPNTCMFTFPLPKSLCDVFDKDTSLSDNVSVRFGGEPFNNEFQLDYGNSLSNALMGGFSASDKTTCFLQIRIDGFIDQYGLSTTLHNAQSLLRAVFGLGIAHRIWRIRYKWTPEPPTSSCYCHTWAGGIWRKDDKFLLDRTLASAIDKLEPDNLGGSLKTAADFHEWTKLGLKRMSPVLAASNRNKLLLRGAQWFFDSLSGDDMILSFIRAAVVAEILLGEDAKTNEVGLTSLLSNRCAYFISQNQSERETILKDFKDIYDVRSKIVHTGFDRLTKRERDMLDKLQWMCARIIQKESDMLAKFAD